MDRRALIDRYWAEEDGATAIEYGLIVGIISAALIGIVGTGGALDSVYDRVSLIIDALRGEAGEGGAGDGP